MTVSLKSLGIEHLGVEERLALVEELWDSIIAESAVLAPTPAQLDELERRVADHEKNPKDVVPWEDAKAACPRQEGG